MIGPPSFEHLTGYVTPLVAKPGDVIQLRASSSQIETIGVRPVRLACVNGEAVGPNQRIEPASFGAEREIAVSRQSLDPGGRFEALLSAPILLSSFSLAVALQPTLSGKDRVAWTLSSGGAAQFAVGLGADDQLFALVVGMQVNFLLTVPTGRWSIVTMQVDAEQRRLEAQVTPVFPGFPRREVAVQSATVENVAVSPMPIDAMTIGATVLPNRISFDGRVDRPTLALGCVDLANVVLGTASPDDCLIHWTFAASAAPRQRHTGRCSFEATAVNHPLTAVKGVRWTGESHDRRLVPDHYSAAHFNSDAMTEADWASTTELAIPADAESGVYAFELTRTSGERAYASFVISAATRKRNRLAVLLPTYTYLAYSNASDSMRGPNSFPGPYAAEQLIDRAAGAFGRSIYDRFADRSGVVIVSERRPMVSFGPDHQPWGYNIDSWLLDWLAREGISFDVVTDHDLHRYGKDALDGYDCVVTGHHPEYVTTRMWDGVAAWLAGGGRLMYLGGNGFYWRTAVDDTGAIEVRRAEDGTRPFIGAPGEYVHAFSDEVGGLWRRLGRPPQSLVGVGMAAQGFSRAAHYRKSSDAGDPRVAFIFDGVDSDTFGNRGALGGGASGYEIDRYDRELGSSSGAFLLATSEGHAPDMLRTKEELLSFVPPFMDRRARSDVVLSPYGNGDVFAVGSMVWVAALHCDPGIARITRNVVQRFLDPTPLPRKHEQV